MTAPNSPLRSAVTALARPAGEVTVPAVVVPTPRTEPAQAAEKADEPPYRKAARYAWARLLARLYEVLPLLCPKCGGAMRIIHFITEAAAIRDIPRPPGSRATIATVMLKAVGIGNATYLDGGLSALINAATPKALPAE